VITLLVMTDGRGDCLRRSIDTFHRLKGPISVRVIHDDSGDPGYSKWLWAEYGDTWTVHSTVQRSGFAGAYHSAWSWLLEHDRNDWIFSTEDDFLIRRDVDLTSMVRVLESHPKLAQLALRRQAWNPMEIAAGGIVEQHPDDYTDVRSPDGEWLEHRRFWTTNPSLFNRRMLHRGWPDGPHSEGHFGISLFTDTDDVCGFWGSRDSGTWVEHIGRERIGTGY
jgi:hypothetical protein